VILLPVAPPAPGVHASTQSSAPAASSQGCASCHRAISASYAHAAMDHALDSVGVDPALSAHPDLRVQIGSYSYAVQTRDGQSSYTVSDAAGSLTLPIRWTFGQHSKTWVLEKDGEFYESQVSYFHREHALGPTPGDENLGPHNLNEAIGRKVSVWELLQCFNCHATNATAGENLTLDRVRPGVDCEHCHEGAQQHQADALRGILATRPASHRDMNAEDAANFCGQCHRTWQSAVRNHWHGPLDVRFQPYRLANSKCFVGNDPRISCLACHDPHQPLVQDVAYYDSKCLACHTASKQAGDASATPVCKVATANCVTCHMPRVTLPGGHLTFTDHMIRIVHPGDPYPG
jgi:hypothetical protein